MDVGDCILSLAVWFIIYKDLIIPHIMQNKETSSYSYVLKEKMFSRTLLRRHQKSNWRKRRKGRLKTLNSSYYFLPAWPMLSYHLSWIN